MSVGLSTSTPLILHGITSIQAIGKMSNYSFVSYSFLLILSLIPNGVIGFNWKSIKDHAIAVFHTNSDKIEAVSNDFKKTLNEHFGDSYHKIADVVDDVIETFSDDNVPKSLEKIGAVPGNVTKNIVAVGEDVKKTFDEHFRDRVERVEAVGIDIKNTWNTNFGEIEKIGTIVNDLGKTLDENFGERTDGFQARQDLPEEFHNKLKFVVHEVARSVFEQYGHNWQSKLGDVRNEVGRSLNQNLGERWEKILDVPDNNVTVKFEAILNDVVKSLNDNFAETLEKAGSVAKDITKPYNAKVDESLEKIGARLGTTVEREPERPEQPASTAFLSQLIVGSGVMILLVICSILGFYMWYRKRYTILSKDEVVLFRKGKGIEGNDEGLGLDGREFPQEFEISRSRFILLNLIGKGNFGLVYKASLSDKEESGSSNVAVKMPHPGCSKDSFKSILAELKVLCYVGNHPHVLEFVGAYIEEIGRGIVYIATQLCENGALQECLRKAYTQLEGSSGNELVDSKPNLYELSRYAHEIAMGMEYISSRKIIHGDLSTRNVLLDSNNVCKIGDFGLSRKLYEYQMLYEKQKGLELPWRSLALESLTRLEFSTKSDVWMYGITLWEIFSLGCLPYPSKSFTKDFLEELEEGFRMSAPALSTDAIYEQMRLCWDAKPEERPTFTELAQFFASTRNMQYTTVVL